MLVIYLPYVFSIKRENYKMRIYIIVISVVMNMFCSEENFFSSELFFDSGYLLQKEEASLYDELCLADGTFLSEEGLAKVVDVVTEDNVDQSSEGQSGILLDGKLCNSPKQRKRKTIAPQINDHDDAYSKLKRRREQINFARLRLRKEAILKNFTAQFDLSNLSHSEKSVIDEKWQNFIDKISDILSYKEENSTWNFKKKRPGN
jgi:hypothetical protein